MIKPGFVHITKTGGTAIKRTISQSYKEYFLLDGFNEKAHNLDASFFDNPFVIVRDPVDRFFSLYSYWINGSEIFSDNIPKYTIHDFVYFLKNKDCVLNTLHTWVDFFNPQSNWIKPEDYKKTVVLIYKSDLSESFNSLLNYFNIPIKSAKVPSFNVTRDKIKGNWFFKLTKNLSNSVEFIYGSDFELYNNVLNNSSLFKKVVY